MIFNVLLGGCSALVQLDDDKYVGGSSGGMVGDEGTPGAGGQPDAGDGNSPPTGGQNATGGLGGTDGSGASDGSGGADGTGGVIEPELPIPVHYYPLDGNLNDEVETVPSFPAQASSTTSWRSNGVRNGAYEVLPHATDPMANLGLNPAVGATNAMTLSFWFVPTADNFYTLVSKTDHTSGGTGWQIKLDNGNARVLLGPNSDEEHLISGNTLPLSTEGEWTHLVFAYEQDHSGTKDLFQLWLNGESVLSKEVVSAYSLVNTNSEIRFGYQQNLNISDFEGLIDEVRVYDQVLTDAEVVQLYELDEP